MTTTYKYTYTATYNGQTETGDFETDNFKATNDELVDMVLNIVMPRHGPYCNREEISVNIQELISYPVEDACKDIDTIIDGELTTQNVKKLIHGVVYKLVSSIAGER